MKKLLGVICMMMFMGNGQAQVQQDMQTWVDSVYGSLSWNERIGQLFMIRAHSDLGASHIAAVEAQIEKYKVGGLCFFQGTPEKQVQLVNRYQQLSKDLPLLVAIDGEWGLGMRMKESTISYPRQLTLGAIQNNRLIYQMGREIGHQLNRTGVHVNFAPVLDINNNPNNPVINTRSFGEDRYNVTIKSYMYMKGMQDVGIMACGKHFPGHGDTDVDSHLDLPVIKHPLDRLDSLELFPFKSLAAYGIGSMMVAHLSMPGLDDRPNRPTTLSYNTVTNLLKGKLNFKGIIFTDALEMKGVTKYFDSGQVEAEALLAGNDMLVLPEDIGAALKTIKSYLREGKLSENRIEESVKKILRAKYELQLHRLQPVEEENVRKEVNTPRAKALRRELFKEALTMVRNKNDLIPFQTTGDQKMATISIGASAKTTFQKRLDSYGKFRHLQLSKNISTAQRQQLIGSLADQAAVIVSLHDLSDYASKDFGLTQSLKAFINELNEKTNVILVVFGTPYLLKYFDAIDWVLEAYQENKDTEELAAQALFGAFSIKGRLPVTASARSAYNVGVVTKAAQRFGYADPEDVDLHPDTLLKIDELANEAIAKRATPGCVVLVAKDGNIVYHKAFGYHTYKRRRRMRKDDVFDLASVTKIAATTISVMQLAEQNKLDIDLPMSVFLPELKASNKIDLVTKDVMAHHAGLLSWIPFYEKTVSGRRRNKRPMSKYYRNESSEEYIVPVANRLFMRRDYTDSIWYQIIHSDLRPNNNYRYSDLGFYLLSKMVHRVSQLPLDRYANDNIYRPLGLEVTGFNPWRRISRSRIVPTEEDRYFRRQKVQGYVHDMGAAMLGGVSGHAGLFSNAEELATIMQMLLQGGYYGNHRFLKPQTIAQFTTRHPRSTRRGIGFDMLELDKSRSINFSTLASSRTFGHLGFTGISTWADPVNNIVFVFLSNRTYPSMYNYKLNKYDYRPRIQSVIYEAMMSEIEEEQRELPQVTQ